MAWVTPRFRPGLNKLDPGLANEGGYTDANLMRIWQGMPQPVGGRTLHSSQGFDGIARGGLSWRTLEGKPAAAWGTAAKLYAEVAGARFDVTPRLHETTLNNVFTTVNASPTVTVTLAFHRLRPGDIVTFSNHQSTVGGLTIDGPYTVVDVPDPSHFTFTHGSNASSTVTTPGGGYIDFTANLPAGLESNPLTGYGSDTMGSGPFGGGADNAATIRTWSLANWGEFLLANPTGYGLFEYQPEISYPELAFNGTFTGNANGWALGTGYSYASNAITAAAGTISNLSQNVDGILEGGKYYLVTFTVTRTAGTLKFQVNAGVIPAVIDVGTASSPITKSGTYTRLFLCPADPKDVVWNKDATFAGTIDTISYSQISRAYRIVTAPPRIDAMFVEPAGLVVALGTTLADGTYSGTAYRCSALGNNRSWVPDSNSLASEQVLRGIGGRLMGGINTSEQNLVWGDEGVLSLRYIGEIGKAFDPIFLGAGCGLISRRSMCAANGFVFWMSNTKQMFAFRGIDNNALGKPEVMVCQIQPEVFDNIDYNQADKIWGGINTTYAEAWFGYPDSRDSDADDPSECSRIATVSWTEGSQDTGIPWMLHRWPITTWIAPGTFQYPIGFADIEGVNYIFDHETGKTDNGSILNWWLETSPFDTGEGETMFNIMRIMAEIAQHTGDINIYLKIRFKPDAAQITRGPYRKSPGEAYTTPLPRLQCRDAALRFEPVSADSWGRLSQTRIDVVQQAARR